MLLTDEIDVDTARPADPEPDLGELGTRPVRVVATDPAADPVRPWSLIVANAAGGPGLDVRADLGLRFGFLTAVGAGLLALRVLLLATTFAPTFRRPTNPLDPTQRSKEEPS